MYLNQTWPQTITYHNVIISLPYFVTYSASYQRPGFSLSYSLSRFLSQKYSFLFHFLPSDAHTTRLPSTPPHPTPCWDVTKRANCPHRQTPSNALRWNCAAWFAVIHSHTNIYCTFFTFATTLNLFQMPFTGTGVASVPWFDSTKYYHVWCCGQLQLSTTLAFIQFWGPHSAEVHNSHCSQRLFLPQLCGFKA